MLAQILTATISVVLSIGGNAAEIDQGLIDGVRRGDTCAVFYTLKVGHSEKRIEITHGVVTEVNDFDATITVAESTKLKVGHQVECQVDEDRLLPITLLELAQQRENSGKLETALAYLQRIEKKMPEDLLLRMRIKRIETKQKQELWREEELKKVGFYRQAAEEMIRDGELDAAESYIDKIRKVEPADLYIRVLVEQVKEKREAMLPSAVKEEPTRQISLEGMLRLEAGVYEIGLELGEAKNFNQTPRFEVKLEAYAIDLSPVSAEQVYEVDSNPASNDVGAGTSATSIPYKKAVEYCESLGKRLPTEFEWEISSRNREFSTQGISEWTTSWYQPYPGNVIFEEDYGNRFRVLRGPESQIRYYMDPTSSDIKVGFRCAVAVW